MQWKRPTWAQALLRDTVIKREERLYLPQFPSASLRNVAATPKTGHLILQAISRANSATYADGRLVVCVCKAHRGWKSLVSNRNKKQYVEIVRELLPPERVMLWDACEGDSWRPHRAFAADWKLAEAALKAEFHKLAVN